MCARKSTSFGNFYGNWFSMIPTLVPKQAGNVNANVFSILTHTHIYIYDFYGRLRT
jgi:hypothetical protein